MGFFAEKFMKLSSFHTFEFIIFLFIVFVDVASVNIWQMFSENTRYYVYYVSESVRTFLLYWFIYYLLSLQPIKDKRVQKATFCAAHAMVYYAAAYVVKEVFKITMVSWVDWTIFGATVVFWVVKYFGFKNIKLFFRSSIH